MRSTFVHSTLVAAIAIAFSVPALAAEQAHEHAAANGAQLELNQGKKWQTDEALATKLTGEVAYIVANCKLDPKADAELHKVIAEVLAGAEAMQGKEPGVARRDGAVRAVKALNAYGQYFDHPGWRKL